MAEIVVEISNEKNRAVMFQPVREFLRPNWANYRVSGSAPKISSLPEIPGVHLAVDIENKQCRLFDPLENISKDTWERVQNVLDAYPQHFKPMKPWPERKFEDCSDNQIKTWLWWMRRMIDGKLAKVIKGELPGIDEILEMPGKATVSQGNLNARRAFTAEEDTTFGQQFKVRKKTRGGRQLQESGAGGIGGAGGKIGEADKK